MISESKNKKCNPFVAYLNSLQRTGGSNENSLAESQSCNPFFSQIHIMHPIENLIKEELLFTNGAHVILTGNAGDGKSTIALEIFKNLIGIPKSQALKIPMLIQENIESMRISIIKDFSERNKNFDHELLNELSSSKNRYLIVSNTGTLLDFFKNQSHLLHQDKISIENDVLKAISSDSGESLLLLGQLRFKIFNLSRIDNLNIAKAVFEKIISKQNWDPCENCNLKQGCPIFLNHCLFYNYGQRIVERIFLLYRRMYEYGTRLTMRQITEHLAYMLTSNLSYDDILKLQLKNSNEYVSKYLFYNTFFGDDGITDNISAQKQNAIMQIRKQNFGEKPNPAWEQKLWSRVGKTDLCLGVPELKEIFEIMRYKACKDSCTLNSDIKPTNAREQIRRILYFLYDFPKDDKSYISSFLHSPAILDWYSWQSTEARLELMQKTLFEQQIYHVLLEHFTCIRLPEGSTHSSDKRLYITLNRRRNEVRQSVQIVLAELDWTTSVQLSLQKKKSVVNDFRQDLILQGKERILGVDLKLTLPFLDYVVMRHFGELGEILQAAYLDRIERYKNEILKKTKTSDEEVLIVRLKTDHTFRRQNYLIDHGCLEVSDAM